MQKIFLSSIIGLLVLLFNCENTSTNHLSADVDIPDWAFPAFEKVDSLNPILQPSPELIFTDPVTGNTVNWEERNVLNPTAIVKNDTVYLFYRTQDLTGTSRIGMAVSGDGLNFEKRKKPVFYPDNDSMKIYEWNYRKVAGEAVDLENCPTCYFDGVEDPRIVESKEGRYFMTYTAYDGKTARLCIASSEDLISWTKHGLVLKEEQYRDYWSKAGAIVSERIGNRMVAKKINGKYWMYFGDTNLFMVTSEDLIHWEVALNKENQQMISVLHPRPGYFDSRLVEPGPYALWRDAGIVLIYNASNAANFNDPALPKFTYAAGQALFDKEKPYQVIDRTDTYFIHPEKDYEKVGEVNDVCFVEGLVWFQERWFLYYGTADSKVAVAVGGLEVDIEQ